MSLKKLIQEWWPGWRLVKTCLSVMICIFIYHLFHVSNPMIACLSAIFSLRETHDLSLHFGKSRLIGNATGASIAVLLVLLHQAWPHFWLELLTVPLGIGLFIQMMNRFHNPAGIINGSAALLMVYFTSLGHQPLVTAFYRVLDTFVGAFIAILINRFVHPAPLQTKAEEQEDIKERMQQLKAEYIQLEKTLRKEEENEKKANSHH